MRDYDNCTGAQNAAGCEPGREPSIQDRLNAIKERLGEASAVLEKTLSVLRGGNTEKCCGDAPRPISCVMDELEVTIAMSERVLRLALDVAGPFQG